MHDRDVQLFDRIRLVGGLGIALVVASLWWPSAHADPPEVPDPDGLAAALVDRWYEGRISEVTQGSVDWADLDGDGLDDEIALVSFDVEPQGSLRSTMVRVLDIRLARIEPNADTGASGGDVVRFERIGVGPRDFFDYEVIDRVTVEEGRIEVTTRWPSDSGLGQVSRESYGLVGSEIVWLEGRLDGPVQVDLESLTEPFELQPWAQSVTLDLGAGRPSYEATPVIVTTEGPRSVGIRTDRPGAGVRIYGSSGRLVGVARDGDALRLPSGGRWSMVAWHDGVDDTRIEVVVDDDTRALMAPQTATMAIAAPGTGTTRTIRFPIITWAHRDEHLDSVNRQIEQLALEAWQLTADVRSDCPSGYSSVWGSVELASYDLVSIRLSSSHDGCGNGLIKALGLTVDLNTGRALSLDDVLTGDYRTVDGVDSIADVDFFLTPRSVLAFDRSRTDLWRFYPEIDDEGHVDLTPIADPAIVQRARSAGRPIWTTCGC